MGTAKITEWDMARSAKAENGVELTVDFDPKSLSLTYTPTGIATASTAGDNRTVNKTPPQQTGQSASMTVELTFDTSTTNTSVQEKTEQLVALTLPNQQSRRVLQFSWGNFLFHGMLNSLGQTIDFFSDTGTPLRATMNLTLSRVDPPNPDNSPSAPGGGLGASFGAGVGIGASASFGIGASVGASASLGVGAGVGIGAGFAAGASIGATASFGAGAAVGTTPLTFSQSGDTVAAITARSGSGASWKSVAAANNIDNPRLVPPGTILDAQAHVG
jgi:hypothetical protein